MSSSNSSQIAQNRGDYYLYFSIAGLISNHRLETLNWSKLLSRRLESGGKSLLELKISTMKTVQFEKK